VRPFTVSHVIEGTRCYQQLRLAPEIDALALSLCEEICEAAVEASFDRVRGATGSRYRRPPKRRPEQETIRPAADFEAFYETGTPPANDTLSTKALQ
jgi:hypothetical protein